MTLHLKIVNQFKKPSGTLGRLAGFIMANRPSNRMRNEWTVSLLKLEPHFTVLEIGCGPGLAIKACSKKVTDGMVIGLDHSEVMVFQSKKRLAKEIAEKKVRIMHDNLYNLSNSSLQIQFNRIYSLNVVQFFPDIDIAFQQIHRLLSDGGMVATTFQPRSSNPTRSQALAMADKIKHAMINNGFTEIQTQELPLAKAPAVCVTGIKVPLIG
jgi:cyclopropane fatty-acyl-phospholipid synthase-like methyltransferase